MSATPEAVSGMHQAQLGEKESSTGSPVQAAEVLQELAEADPVLASERIMAHLRSPVGCPWDREQTFDSIRQHTLEEVYEVFDAIERRDWTALQEELGDLLLQVLFYAQMASEERRFSFSDVARSLNAKLIRRHPHIFGTAAVADSAEVTQNWDRIKQEEKRLRGEEETPASRSLLTAVPRHMPALSEARKLSSAAASIGFDWTDQRGVFAKAQEELAELEQEMSRTDGASRGAIEEEFGDVLFSLVSLARHLKLDPEMSLRSANAKFRRRFSAMEVSAAEMGFTLESRTPEELDRLWTEAKRAVPAEEDPA